MKNKFSSILIIILCLFMFVPSGRLSAQMFSPGEELEYDVSFIGIRLGSVKIISERIDSISGRPVYKAVGYMNSRSGLPFVDLHAIFHTWADTSFRRSQQFVGQIKITDERWDTQKIWFKKDKNKILNYKWHGKKQVRFDTIATGIDVSDGLSLYFLARQFCGKKANMKISTLIDRELENTYLQFTDKKEAVEVDIIPYPVRTSYFRGKAEWNGIYGISGEFEGWFSDDEARVPIVAKMKVYVGSVRIELVKWKRKGWVPPKAKED